MKPKTKDEDVSTKRDATQNKAYTSKEETRAAQLTDTIKKLDEFKSVWVQSQLSSDKTINYDAGLLSIESDRLHGKLSFRIKSGLSKAGVSHFADLAGSHNHFDAI